MKKYLAVILAVFMVSLLPLTSVLAETRDIFFPTEKTIPFKDDFGDSRSGGRSHEANDLMGKKMTPLYAAVDGVVRDLEIPEASWGYAITLEDADGYIYNYLHLNNDTPGTDDGKGGVENAYAPFTGCGSVVRKGQFIGWMGDSGNAENIGSHLHFEIRKPDRTAINPYPSLRAALGKEDIEPAKTNLTPIVKTKFVFKKNLSSGKSDLDVKEMQKFFNANGFVIAKTGAGSPGNETTYFGSATKDALIKFQKAKKISPASGFFGPMTRAVVNR